VGVLYDRLHTATLPLRRVVNVMPVFARSWCCLRSRTLALPGTSGFVGEFW